MIKLGQMVVKGINSVPNVKIYRGYLSRQVVFRFT